jgi:integrase
MASLRVRSRKDGSSYTAVLYSLDGKQTSTSFNDHAEALAFCELANRTSPAKALEVWRAEYQHASAMTVAQWVADYIDHKTIGADTITKYREYLRNDIKDTIGPLPLHALTDNDVARWIQGLLAKGNSGKTISNKHGFLAEAMKRAARDGKITRNPCEDTQLPDTLQREMVCLTREQFALLHSCVSEYWQPLVEFLVASGCRWSEATALRPTDVDRDEHTVRIRRAWHKGNKLGPTKSDAGRRTINVPPAVLDKLDYGGEWLFVNRAGDFVKSRGFHERVWTPAVVRADLKLDTPPQIRDLRHTCASWMLRAGVPMDVVQEHMGHESIEVTISVYRHISRAEHRVAAAAIAEALGQASPKL